jgi:uncharacterized protein YebE (UPF0316 family)
MTNIFSGAELLVVGAIFVLRIGDMSLDTLRALYTMQGRKKTAWVLGFFQALLFLLAISQVLLHLDNWLVFVAYAAGFATGNAVGISLEKRLAVGHVSFTIISSTLGPSIVERLREDGFAVTEVPARGKDGMVSLLNCTVSEKDVDHVETIVLEADPSAFITARDVRPVRRGFWRS